MREWHISTRSPFNEREQASLIRLLSVLRVVSVRQGSGGLAAHLRQCMHRGRGGGRPALLAAAAVGGQQVAHHRQTMPRHIRRYHGRPRFPCRTCPPRTQPQSRPHPLVMPPLTPSPSRAGHVPSHVPRLPSKVSHPRPTAGTGQAFCLPPPSFQPWWGPEYSPPSCCAQHAAPSGQASPLPRAVPPELPDSTGGQLLPVRGDSMRDCIPLPSPFLRPPTFPCAACAGKQARLLSQGRPEQLLTLCCHDCSRTLAGGLFAGLPLRPDPLLCMPTPIPRPSNPLSLQATYRLQSPLPLLGEGGPATHTVHQVSHKLWAELPAGRGLLNELGAGQLPAPAERRSQLGVEGTGQAGHILQARRGGGHRHTIV